MAWTKAKIAIVAGVSALLAAGTIALVIKHEADKEEDAIFEPIFKTFDQSTLEKLPPTLILRPTRYSEVGNMEMWLRSGNGVSRNLDLVDSIEEAFDAPRVRVLFQEGNGPFMASYDDNYTMNAQTFWPPKMGYKDVDCLVTLPDHQQEALRAEIKRQFGLDVRYEMHQADVLLLQVTDVAKLKAHLTKGGTPKTRLIGTHTDKGRAFTNEPISVVAKWLEGQSGKPVVDTTGLEERYDLMIEWPEKRRLDWQPRRESIRHALEQCGLTLAPSQQLTKMLVIQRVKN
jgi:uncharacterized protein (TIGR03435 family)